MILLITWMSKQRMCGGIHFIYSFGNSHQLPPVEQFPFYSRKPTTSNYPYDASENQAWSEFIDPLTLIKLNPMLSYWIMPSDKRKQTQTIRSSSKLYCTWCDLDTFHTTMQNLCLNILDQTFHLMSRSYFICTWYQLGTRLMKSITNILPISKELQSPNWRQFLQENTNTSVSTDVLLNHTRQCAMLYVSGQRWCFFVTSTMRRVSTMGQLSLSGTCTILIRRISKRVMVISTPLLSLRTTQANSWSQVVHKTGFLFLLMGEMWWPLLFYQGSAIDGVQGNCSS